MATLHQLIPDPQTVLALEPEELAGLALELIRTGDPNMGSRLHPTSFTSPETLGPYLVEYREAIAHALAEGWHWLVAEGLLAPRPGDTNGWHFITRKGQQIHSRENLAAYVNSVVLPRKLLHPTLAKVCWSAFLRGDYDTAVFQAFRELEVAIREACGYGATDYGADMARRAFHEATGPLTDQKKPIAERQSLAHLMAGALGSYKNPHSHRRVSLSTEEAVEMIVLASHLLKIVASRAKGEGAA